MVMGSIFYYLRYSLALLKDKDNLWLHIWNELTQTAGHQLGYSNLVGNTPELTQISKLAANGSGSIVVPGQILYVPFEFWFNMYWTEKYHDDILPPIYNIIMITSNCLITIATKPNYGKLLIASNTHRYISKVKILKIGQSVANILVQRLYGFG